MTSLEMRRCPGRRRPCRSHSSSACSFQLALRVSLRIFLHWSGEKTVCSTRDCPLSNRPPLPGALAATCSYWDISLEYARLRARESFASISRRTLELSERSGLPRSSVDFADFSGSAFMASDGCPGDSDLGAGIRRYLHLKSNLDSIASEVPPEAEPNLTSCSATSSAVMSLSSSVHPRPCLCCSCCERSSRGFRHRSGR